MLEIYETLQNLSIDEKISLLSGSDFWNTKEIVDKGIQSIMVADGPHGLRKEVGEAKGIGIRSAVKATCFPTGSALASSWDKKLIQEVGNALGREAKGENVKVLLGPAVNIKRSPVCGRNFEYFSEDPFLSSTMAEHFIAGVQDIGVGTSIKHFAANNQEYKRMSVDTIVDERTLREIYLASFEKAIKDGKPWTVMSAYNQLNGEFCSDNKKLLTDVLRKEWGYEGLVLSDWGAEQNRILGILAGMDLEMPGNNGINHGMVKEAVERGDLTEEELDKSCMRVLELIKKSEEKSGHMEFSPEEHHAIARKAAGECAVLLKNDNNVLPLLEGEKIAVIGEFAIKPRYQGGGSSHINPTFISAAWDEMEKRGGEFSKGYSIDSDENHEGLISEAVALAQNSNKVVVFAGLPDRYESEGYDRDHMRIPENQVELIKRLSRVNENIIVVLSNGSPVEMPWIKLTKAVLEGYLGGQAVGAAVSDILYGDVNPSGKLAETFPMRLENSPSWIFGTEDNTVAYHEGIYVGYRYYEKKKIDVLFPFGHGLSYTDFQYTGISIDKEKMKDSEVLKVKVTIKNTGRVEGKEVVQLYVKDLESTVHRPEKELKGFEKIHLKPGEEGTVEFSLDKRAFAYYNVDIEDWHVESGEFKILTGSSSSDIRLCSTVEVQSTDDIKKKLHKYSTIKELCEHPLGKILAHDFIPMSGGNISQEDINASGEMLKSLTLNSLKSLGGVTEEQLEEILRQINQ